MSVNWDWILFAHKWIQSRPLKMSGWTYFWLFTHSIMLLLCASVCMKNTQNESLPNSICARWIYDEIIPWSCHKLTVLIHCFLWYDTIKDAFIFVHILSFVVRVFCVFRIIFLHTLHIAYRSKGEGKGNFSVFDGKFDAKADNLLKIVCPKKWLYLCLWFVLQ